jgi:transcriptional regulator
MLFRRHDAPRDDDEWKRFLHEHRFGQLVAGGTGGRIPFVVPAHYSFDGDATVRLHLARDNPAWQALEESPMAVMAVVDAYAFIPSYWSEPEPYGVGTSYYAAVQAIGACRSVDDPEELADLLRVQLGDMQPEGGQEPQLDADDPGYQRMLRRIRGIEMTITDIRAKFKYGGNKPEERRLEIAERLTQRNDGLDAAARQALLDRLEAEN